MPDTVLRALSVTTFTSHDGSIRNIYDPNIWIRTQWCREFQEAAQGHIALVSSQRGQTPSAGFETSSLALVS